MFLLLAIALFSQSTTLWANELEVEKKIVLNASPRAVWALVGGFKALDRWHPEIIESTLIGTGKKVGDIRILTLADGETIVERLESYDENAMNLQYRILESPLPIENYVASIQVKNIGDKMTEVLWRSSFHAVEIGEGEIKEIISSIYTAGLNSLNNLFE